MRLEAAVAAGGIAGLAGANRTYVVCASPRTGSTLLCSGLQRTRQGGRPREYFDDRASIDAEYKAKLGVDTDVDYLRKVLRVAQSANGLRGLKIHWHQLGVLARMLRAVLAIEQQTEPDLTLASLQRRLFGPVTWIWLRRRDKVAQAVSLHRAARSRVWHRPVGQAHRSDDLPYNFAAIDRLVHICFRYDTDWQKYLAANGIEPLTIWYEDLSADHDATMRTVFDYLGLDGAVVESPALNRVSGSQSAEWIERFNREKVDRVLAGTATHGLPVIRSMAER